MTPQLAAFCGYVLGDGWISNDSQRFGFVVAEPELDIMPILLTVVKEVFGLEPDISRRLIKGRKVPLHYVHMSNKDVAANLSFLRQKSERIVSISRDGPADVYDIEVPDGHRFIANGIISHNTAKSEMLKFAAQVAPRGLFASGRGSTAAGLSAAVIREKNVFMLEAGVVVLADQGIACLTGDSEIYLGGSLTPIETLWERGVPLAVSASGERELRSIYAQVPSFEQKGKKDVRGVARRISRKYLSGQVVELTFSSGLNLKVTPEHMVRRHTVNPRWIRADELREGDLVKTVGSFFGPNLRLAISDRQAYFLGSVYG